MARNKGLGLLTTQGSRECQLSEKRMESKLKDNPEHFFSITFVIEKKICLFMNSDCWIFLKTGPECPGHCFSVSAPLPPWILSLNTGSRGLNSTFSQTALAASFCQWEGYAWD